MPRRPRLNLAGGVFHVTSRANRCLVVASDDHDRWRWLTYLTDTIEEQAWQCLSYCLMTNHFHLLLRTPEPNLSRGMYRLNSRYVHSYNRRHDVEGHLFERRFRSRNIVSDVHLFKAIRYVHMNPVEAGLCRHPAEWNWSSYRAIIGMEDDPAVDVNAVLAHFARDTEIARSIFSDFVCENLGKRAA